MAKAQCFLQLKVESSRKADGTYKVVGVKIVNMTQSPPTQLAEGATHLVDVRLEIPDRMLAPIVAEAMIPELQLQAEFEATMKELEA